MSAGDDDRAFDEVFEGSLVSYACSPDLHGDLAFRGLRVAAPRRVLFEPGRRARDSDAFARVILCGSHHLDSSYLGFDERFLPSIVVVAVNAGDHRAWCANLAELAGIEPPPHRRLTAEQRKGRSIIEHWNPNLAALLALPEEEADYWAYATLGEHVSNVVRIEVRRTPLAKRT